SPTMAPVTPQVGVALSRWYSSTLRDRWSTTAPVIGGFSTYAFEGTQGYLMTKPHPTLPTNKLEDCVSYWQGTPDHMLTNDGQCAPTDRLRTAGWVFQTLQPGTIPLYRCHSVSPVNHFVSNSPNCEGLGTQDWLLGYALAN